MVATWWSVYSQDKLQSQGWEQSRTQLEWKEKFRTPIKTYLLKYTYELYATAHGTDTCPFNWVILLNDSFIHWKADQKFIECRILKLPGTSAVPPRGIYNQENLENMYTETCMQILVIT